MRRRSREEEIKRGRRVREEEMARVAVDCRRACLDFRFVWQKTFSRRMMWWECRRMRRNVGVSVCEVSD